MFNITKKTKRICLTATLYNLFLYLLICGYNEEDIFIFTYIFPKEIAKNFKHFQLPKANFIKGPLMAPLNSISGIFENIYGYCRYFYGYLSLRWFLFYTKHKYNCEYEIFGNASTAFSFPFYEIENASIIEDGLLNYSHEIKETHKINPIVDKFLHLCGMYFINIAESLGSHKNIKKVYLTNEHTDPIIREKMVVVDIEKLWNEKSATEKKKILSLFNIDYDMINQIDSNTVLLLTQPLSEANFIPLEEELEIYKKMINKFNGKKVFIKPHPREDKDYKALFPNVVVIDKLFPIEFLKLLKIRPKTIGTVISTVALTFKDISDVYIYDGEISSKQLDDNRNSLLKLLDNQ